MDYHLFKKSIKIKGKIVTYWYYWYSDPVTQKQVQKACKGCKAKYDAVRFIEQLPPLRKNFCKIADIAEDMYLPGTAHVNRRSQLGRSIKTNTMTENRRYIGHIIANFGEIDIRDLKVVDVGNFLFEQKKSFSWKNQFLEIFTEIFAEANWNGIIVAKPIFVRFHGIKAKADILTSEEIEKIFNLANFKNDVDFMLLLVTLSAGLRISEAMALQTRQFLPEKQMIVVDGFLDKKTMVRNNYNKKGSAENPKWRVTILVRKTAELLTNYIEKYEKSANDYLFVHKGTPCSIRHCGYVLNQALASAGVEKNGRKLTPHSLRYTYVTRMRSLLSGDTVQKMVGHSSIEMTDYYTRGALTESTESLIDFVSKTDNFFNF